MPAAAPLVRVALNASTAVEVTFPGSPRACVVQASGGASVYAALVGADGVAIGADYATVHAPASGTAELTIPLVDPSVEGGRRRAIYIQAATGTPTVAVWAVQ